MNLNENLPKIPAVEQVPVTPTYIPEENKPKFSEFMNSGGDGNKHPFDNPTVSGKNVPDPSDKK